MRTCNKCKKIIPNDIYIDKKRICLHKRKYCTDCVPLGNMSMGNRLSSGKHIVKPLDKFGYLTVIEEVDSPFLNIRRDTTKYFKCQCDCGKEIIRRENEIRKGKYGCGCSETNRRKPKLINKNICKKCGEKKLLSEFTICKCKRKSKDGSSREVEYYKNYCKDCVVIINKKKVDTKINYKYNSIKSSSIIRNIDFLISLEEFSTLWDLPCYYCGGDRPTHGLDRKDPNLSYTLDNCVACCKYCNYMKNTLGHDDFIQRVKRIASKFS
jgi:hypothetical protein